MLGARSGPSGGVFDPGTEEEDGPGTWEALASPQPIPVWRRAGEPSPTHGTSAGTRVVGLTRHSTSVRIEVGCRKGNRSGGRWRQGVGGLQRSDDVGERDHAQTRPSKGGPCRCDLHQSTMPNALTLESMSPELVKVVATWSHEPHRRKSRMVEISLSGSGEGPGRVTSRPTLQSRSEPLSPSEAH